MRHNVSGRKLNRTASHRRMLYRNLVTQLFRHERVQTTVPKAKEARSVAERLITCAKAGDLGARRRAARMLTDPAVLQKLFAEIGPRYAERPGGYTRILRLGNRKGDNAELAILELVDTKVRPRVQDSQKRRQRRRLLKFEEKQEARAAIAEEAAEREQEEEAESGAAPAEPEAEPEAGPEAAGAEPAGDEDDSGGKSGA